MNRWIDHSPLCFHFGSFFQLVPANGKCFCSLAQSFLLEWFNNVRRIRRKYAKKGRIRKPWSAISDFSSAIQCVIRCPLESTLTRKRKVNWIEKKKKTNDFNNKFEPQNPLLKSAWDLRMNASRASNNGQPDWCTSSFVHVVSPRWMTKAWRMGTDRWQGGSKPSKLRITSSLHLTKKNRTNRKIVTQWPPL